MFQDILKKQQQVAYQTMYHALHDDLLAHAYMFSGPSGTPKKEAAILFAQSLLCKKNTFACEECNICHRIAHMEYSDVIYIDGTKTSIKKEDILNLQHAFNKTGLEQEGKKVYIIDHVENATIEACNSLLKFLEEPASDMVAILLTENMDRVLPTIVSRCQIIPFVPLSANACYEACREEMEPVIAYVLSQLIRNIDGMKQAQESDSFQHGYYVWKGFMERMQASLDSVLLFLQLEGFPNKNQDKEAFIYMLDLLLIIYKDSMKKECPLQDAWYQTQYDKLQKQNENSIKIIEIIMNARDKAIRSVNLSLLMEQMIYEMKEVLLCL